MQMRLVFFLIFMQFSAKIIPNNSHPIRPPLRAYHGQCCNPLRLNWIIQFAIHVFLVIRIFSRATNKAVQNRKYAFVSAFALAFFWCEHSFTITRKHFSMCIPPALDCSHQMSAPRGLYSRIPCPGGPVP